MCEILFAPGSKDLVIGVKRCDDPNCPRKKPQTITQIGGYRKNKRLTKPHITKRRIP